MVDVRRTIELRFQADGRQFLNDLREASRLSRELATNDRARIAQARAIAAEARAQAAEARALAAQQKQQSQDELNALKAREQAVKNRIQTERQIGQQLKNQAQEEKNATAAQQNALKVERESLRLDKERINAQNQLNQAQQEEIQTNDRLNPGLLNLAAGLSILRNGYFAVFEVINQVNRVGQQFFNTFIASNEELQKSAVSTAAGIASTNAVFDAAGNPIDDTTEAIQRLLPQLETARQEVVALAAGIPGVTEGDIQPIFNLLAQNVGQLGGDLERIPELSAHVTAALQTFGIPLFQARQEVNALLRGQIDQNAALANNLQIRREDIELARQQGRLFEFLNDQFQSAAAGAGILSDLTENSLSNIQTVLSRITREIGRPFLEPIQQGLQRVSEFVNRIEAPVLRIFEQVRSRAATFLEPILNQLSVIRERLQPFFDALPAFFQAVRGRIDALSESVRRTISAIVESGIVELIATQLGVFLRGITELVTLALSIGNIITEGFTTAVVGFIDIFQPVIEIIQALVDGAEALRAGVIETARAFNEWISESNEGLGRLVRVLNAVATEILRTGSIAEGVLAGQLAFDPEIQLRVGQFDRRAIQDELEEIARQASQDVEFSLPTEEFEELRDRIEAAYNPETAANLIAGLEQILGLTEDTNDETSAQELALESLEEQRRREEVARINAFQDELDIFAQQKEFRTDALNDIKEETTERQRQAEIAAGALRIQEALANLQLSRGARAIRDLEEEGQRISDRLDSLREEGASRSRIRRAEREEERNRQRLQEEREAQALREFNLQQTQLQAQSAQIEAQRVLNQLKVDQLEIETEISRLNQEEQLATLQNQLEQVQREGGDPGKERELERSIADLQERLGDTIERQGTFDQQRADFDRAAAEQQAVLGIQQQAAVEAFVDEFGRLLLESGDREATSINENDRLSFDERQERLQDLAQERSGVTIETPEINVAAPSTTVEVEQGQQANEANVRALLEQLDRTGQATGTFTPQESNVQRASQTAAQAAVETAVQQSDTMAPALQVDFTSVIAKLGELQTAIPNEQTLVGALLGEPSISIQEVNTIDQPSSRRSSSLQQSKSINGVS